MTGHTENEIVIAAPPALTWELTNDVERWTELFTQYASVEVLERDGDTTAVRLTLHPDQNGYSPTWVARRTLDHEARVVMAHREETRMFDRMHVCWEYTETADGHTRMRWTQDFELKPTAGVDEAAMTAHINENTCTQMAHIREKVEAHAAKLPQQRPSG